MAAQLPGKYLGLVVAQQVGKILVRQRLPPHRIADEDLPNLARARIDRRVVIEESNRHNEVPSGWAADLRTLSTARSSTAVAHPWAPCHNRHTCAACDSFGYCASTGELGRIVCRFRSSGRLDRRDQIIEMRKQHRDEMSLHLSGFCGLLMSSNTGITKESMGENHVILLRVDSKVSDLLVLGGRMNKIA